MTTGFARNPRGTDVQRSRAVTLLLPAAALLGVAVAMSWARHPPARPGAPTDAVYTVAHLSDQLAVHPAQWVGQVVRVSAVAVILPLWVTRGTVPTRIMVSRLVDPGGGGSLPLVLGPEDRVLAALRRLPVVGALAPPSQARVWNRLVVYRVQVEASSYAGRDTYEAVLLDAEQSDT